MTNDDYDGLRVQPGAHTYSFSLKVNAHFDCPVTIEIKRDSFLDKRLVLSGDVDTVIHRDWYEMELGIKVYPKSCVDEEDIIAYCLYD